MDAVIMAAGRGSRLGDITDHRPKCLLDLGGISPIELQVEFLIARNVTRLVVVTGYRRELLETAVLARARERLDVAFVWNPFWPISNVLASAWMARGELMNPFIYMHADTVFDPSILDDLLDSREDAALPVDIRATDPEQMKAKIEDGLVVHLSKELSNVDSEGEFVGIGVFNSPAVEAVASGMDAAMKDGLFTAYFEEAINWAVRERRMRVEAVPTAGRAWTEIDFPEDLELAKRLLPSFIDRQDVK